MDKIEIVKVKNEEIKPLSILATSILREHYDPILGKEQNDYMLEKFQSEKAIKEQIEQDIYIIGPNMMEKMLDLLDFIQLIINYILVNFI